MASLREKDGMHLQKSLKQLIVVVSRSVKSGPRCTVMPCA